MAVGPYFTGAQSTLGMGRNSRGIPGRMRKSSAIARIFATSPSARLFCVRVNEITETEKLMQTPSIFSQLCARLDRGQARYRVVEHASAGRSEEVAAQRGTALGQGAKALVCHVKGNGLRQHVLAVLPADCQADLQRLAQGLGGTRASLASPAEVETLTRCVFGAIPPFSFHPDLLLVADPHLFSRFDELAFNAGSLERSLILNTQDYRRIAEPRELGFIRL